MADKSRRPVVVLTGAAAGVGRAVPRAFATRGYAVALLARGVDELEGARREIEAAGGHAIVVPTDVTIPLAQPTDTRTVVTVSRRRGHSEARLGLRGSSSSMVFGLQKTDAYVWRRAAHREVVIPPPWTAPT